MSVGKAARSNSKQSSRNTLSFIMLQICLQRGCVELDPVDMPIEICQLEGQLDQVQKHIFEHLLRNFITYIIMVFCDVEFCFVPFSFLCHSPLKSSKNQT